MSNYLVYPIVDISQTEPVYAKVHLTSTLQNMNPHNNAALMTRSLQMRNSLLTAANQVSSQSPNFKAQ